MFRYAEPYSSARVLENLKRISEKTVQAIWHYLFLKTQALQTTQKENLIILEQGIWNGNDGPDFRNAKIKIGSTVYQGDVEIHTRTSDWFHHGHTQQGRYARVILHAVLDHDITPPDDHPPVLEMRPYLSDSLDGIVTKIETLERTRKNIFCYEELPHLSKEAIEQWVLENGLMRFRSKIQSFRELYEHRSLSWEELLYGGLMEALGYSKNRRSFRRLAEILPFRMLRHLILHYPDSTALMYLQAVFFGASGLLEKEIQAVRDQTLIPYLQRLEQLWFQWHSVHPLEPLSASEWQLSGLRPANYPTLRIAGFSRWLVQHGQSNLMEPFLNLVQRDASPSDILRRMEKILTVPVYGYWTHHYLWNDAGRARTDDLIGQQRAHEMIVNVVLPVLGLFAESSGSNDLSERILHLYREGPSREKNSLLQRMIQQLFRKPVSRMTPQFAQGLIHLYRRCVVLDCGDCDLFAQTVQAALQRHQEDSGV